MKLKVFKSVNNQAQPTKPLPPPRPDPKVCNLFRISLKSILN